jgi:serine/threonine protein kinase
VDDAINYTVQIAAGLQTAHEAGIVHRDIRSASIMVNDKGKIK